jgi:hypothetical protein
MEREETLLFACEHEETGPIQADLAGAVSGMRLDTADGPRAPDPARGGVLVPFAEWHRRVRVPAPSFVRVAGEAEDPVWRNKPAAVPWPAPVAAASPPPGRSVPPLPLVRSAPTPFVWVAWALTAACLAGLVGTIQWSIESWGRLGLSQVMNGLLLVGGLAFLARLARAAAADSRPALVAGRLAAAGGLVVAGALLGPVLI